MNTATATGAVYCNNLGIGAIAGGATRLNVAGGGSANFGGNCVFNGTDNTFQNNILSSSRGRIYQQGNANFSLNHIATIEQNFCIQSNRSADPTASDIFVNLNDVAGITLNKATTCNETVDIIGNLTCENEFRVDIGATGTPEFRVLGSSVDFFDRFSITHTEIIGAVHQIFLRNPDTDGPTIIEIGTKNVFEVTTNGIDIIGDVNYSGVFTDTSDKRLKDNIREIDQKEAIDIVKYIKPRTYIKKDRKRKSLGFIANDMKEVLPDEWDNIVMDGKDGYLRMDYTKTTPILWSALQHLLKENEEMKKSVAYLKGEITKLKKSS